MAQVTEKLNEIECAECGAEYPLLAVARCKACGSRQMRRLSHTPDELARNVALRALEALELAEAALRRHELVQPAEMARLAIDEGRAKLRGLP